MATLATKAETQEFTNDKGVILFWCPPHCTRRVQLLDVISLDSLAVYYNEEVNKWLKSHSGRAVSHYKLAGLFKNAYQQVAILSNPKKSSSITEIYPFNPDWKVAQVKQQILRSYRQKICRNMQNSLISPCPVPHHMTLLF